MNVLIACEYSGIIREAFADKGHNAWSCDLLESEIPGKHIQGDVLGILYQGWDLMIAHPPCTFLSYAATKYWNQPGRIWKRLDALAFFAKLWEAPIPKICIENPMGLASAAITNHHQVIHPYYFGDRDMKRTCLWLKNLPLLVHTEQDTLFDQKTHTDKPEPIYVKHNGENMYFTEAKSGSKNGGHFRSKSFTGIARAMAEQWG